MRKGMGHAAVSFRFGNVEPRELLNVLLQLSRMPAKAYDSI